MKNKYLYKKILAGLLTAVVVAGSIPQTMQTAYAVELGTDTEAGVTNEETLEYEEYSSSEYLADETEVPTDAEELNSSDDAENVSDEESMESETATIDADTEEVTEELTLQAETTDEEFDDDPQIGRVLAQRAADLASLIPFNDVESEDIALAYTDTSKYNHGKYASNYDIKRGIDVSYYQGTIDWKKVAADGVEFALIRVAARGYGDAGNMIDDSRYAANIKGAQAAGIPVGVYIFSQATTVKEAEEEADKVLTNIKDYTLQLPVVMDFEYAATPSGVGGRLYKANLSKDAATKICNAFCKKIADAGHEAMVYANYDMLTNHLYASQISNNHKIWIARWNTSTGYAGDYSFWQFTDKGTVNGISGAVDLDFYYEKFEDEPDYDRLVSSVDVHYYDDMNDAYIPVEKNVAVEVTPGTEVVLSSDTENTAIFYTKGTKLADTVTPQAESAIRYTEPIIITGETCIRTIAKKTNFKDSEINAYYFKVKDVSGDQGEVADEDLPEGANQAEKVAKISDGFWTSAIPAQTYTGKALKPSLRVYAGKKLLKEKTDYTLAYRNNVNIGNAVITITGKGSYAGSTQTTFEIVTRDISDSVAAIAPVSVPYNKRNQAPTIALTIDGRKLALNKDYTLSIVKKAEAEGEDIPVTVCNAPGTYIYTVKAKDNGNYHGSGTVIFNIRDNVTSLSNARFKVTNQNYIDWYSMGDDVEDDSDDCFVDPLDGSRRFALEGDNSGIRPVITVTDSKNNIIPESEYDVIFENNNVIGTASVTISAKAESENFVGSKRINFKITGQPITKASVMYTDVGTGEMKDISKALTVEYNGKPYEPMGKADMLTDDVPDDISVSYTLKKGEAPLILKKGRDFTVSYLNNIKAGSATIVITGRGRFSGTLRKTFKIKDYASPESENLSGHILIKFANADKSEVLTDENGGSRNVAEYYYIKGGVTPEVQVYYEPDNVVTPLTTKPSANAILLTAGVDYTVRHVANKAANEYNAVNAKNVSIAPTVTITGKKSFKGNVSVTYSILKADLGRLSITAADKVCTGKAGQYTVVPVITDSFSKNKTKLAAGTDYDKNLEYRLAEANYIMKYDSVLRRSFKRWVAADTLLNPKTDIILDNTAIRVTATGKENYKNTISTVYRMNSLDIAKATVKVADQNYVGKAVRPGKSDVTLITMKVNNKTVNLGPEDYEITGYQKNTGRGTGIMTIHGLGDYCGYKNVTFKINARSLFYMSRW